MNEVNLTGGSSPRDKGSASSIELGSSVSASVNFDKPMVDLKLAGSQIVTGTGKPEKATPQDVTEEKLGLAVSQLNDFFDETSRDIHFSLDEDSGKTVVTVLDTETKVVIRQFPGDVVLKLAQDLTEEEPLYMFSAEV